MTALARNLAAKKWVETKTSFDIDLGDIGGVVAEITGSVEFVRGNFEVQLTRLIVNLPGASDNTKMIEVDLIDCLGETQREDIEHEFLSAFMGGRQ